MLEASAIPKVTLYFSPPGRFAAKKFLNTCKPIISINEKTETSDTMIAAVGSLSESMCRRESRALRRRRWRCREILAAPINAAGAAKNPQRAQPTTDCSALAKKKHMRDAKTAIAMATIANAGVGASQSVIVTHAGSGSGGSPR